MKNNNLVSFKFENATIEFKFGDDELMVNATQMANKGLKESAAMKDGIELIATHKKVLSRLEAPIIRLPHKAKAWYNALPAEGLRYAEAIEIGRNIDISRSSIKRLLNRQDIFKKDEGIYIKIYL